MPCIYCGNEWSNPNPNCYCMEIKPIALEKEQKMPQISPLPESFIAPEITEAAASLATAREALQCALEKTQSACEHRIVSEMPYRAGNYFGSRAAHRICNHCRLIEEGSHWSGGSVWSKHDHSKSDLGNVPGRIVVVIDEDQFWAMRVAV